MRTLQSHADNLSQATRLLLCFRRVYYKGKSKSKSIHTVHLAKGLIQPEKVRVSRIDISYVLPERDLKIKRYREKSRLLVSR